MAEPVTAPSPESRALGRLYQSKGERYDGAAQMGMVALRSLEDENESCSSEAPGVSYESVDAGGAPAIWVTPAGPNVHGVIVYLHGGGFRVGSPTSHRKLAAHFAKAANSHALVLHYRLAPEHPYPAALDDCIAAYQWVIHRGFKPNEIAIAGDSAGGNLAAATILRLRAEGAALPAAAVAFSPWYNLKNDLPSMESNDAKDLLVHKAALHDMAAAYAGKHSLEDPLVNPLYADLAGFPPIFISVGSDETLEDDSVHFSEKARKAGVTVELERVAGQQHVHVLMAGRAPEADTSIQKAGSWVSRHLT
ncbi:hypothetical protein FH972_021188 [Carpinus fangiana]|uniref:Alpha/beta hydrolase fold-3 domain-containing protein n=1 Tax=Carpinus fangiana TaxID=176857 RepID=A0A5N6KP77_9ROSI|nr:hypothetical protein FH972_021188 [Carpinus fangiana]